MRTMLSATRLLSSGLAANGVALSLSFAATFATARLLGAAGRGEVALVMVIASYCVIALGLSLETGLLHFGSRLDPRARFRLVATVRRIVATSYLACAVVLFLLMELVTGDRLDLSVSLVTALGLSAGVVVQPVSALDRIDQRHHAATWRPIGVLCCQQGAGLLSLLIHPAVDVYLMSSALGCGAAVVGYLWLQFRTSQVLRDPTDGSSVFLPSARALIRYCMGGHPGVLLHAFALRFPLVVVSAVAGVTAAGVFSIATSVAELLLIISQSQLAYVLGAGSLQPARFDALRAQLRAGAIAAVLATPVLVAATHVVARFLGSDFAALAPTVAALCPGVVLLGLWRLASYDLAARARATRRTVSAIAGTIVLGLLTAPLTVALGLTGTALSTLIGYAAMFATLLWISRDVLFDKASN